MNKNYILMRIQFTTLSNSTQYMIFLTSLMSLKSNVLNVVSILVIGITISLIKKGPMEKIHRAHIHGTT